MSRDRFRVAAVQSPSVTVARDWPQSLLCCGHAPMCLDELLCFSEVCLVVGVVCMQTVQRISSRGRVEAFPRVAYTIVTFGALV